MKKFVALLLALALTLGLCVPALAASDGTVALRLTGSAAEQVANLEDGQRIASDGGTALRLNVQSDPDAAEYAVTWNGQELAADHSTSQYHFYYLPAVETASGVAVLSVEGGQALNGTGTKDDPCLITGAADLAAFRQLVNAGDMTLCARLMSDITLTGQWTPIANDVSQAYTGTFDGNGHTIRGLTVTAGTAGFIAQTGDGAVIRDLTIAASAFSANADNAYVGAFAAHATGALTLSGCHTAQDVTVTSQYDTTPTGGLVGKAESGSVTITGCSNRAAVHNQTPKANTGAGGLIGTAVCLVTMDGCFNAGKVSSGNGVATGGLIGSAVGSGARSIRNVYNTGEVTAGTADQGTGGLIGQIITGTNTITNAYSAGAVTGGSEARGAIVGKVKVGTTLENVYVLDTLTADANNGSFTGEAVSRTAAEMKATAMVTALGTEFAADSGEVNNGFPVLAWQNGGSQPQPTEMVGTGTESDPYQLFDAATLMRFRDIVNEGGETAVYARLTEDITLTGDWTPLAAFTGELDGNGHTIRGIRIDATGSNQGFISTTRGAAVIRDLTIADSSISVTQTRAGAFVGKADDDSGSLTLSNCHAAADVTISAGTGIAGGLVGQTAGDVTITGCSSRAAVTSAGASNGIGGLVGHAYNGSGRTLTVTESFHAGTVSGGQYAGGLVGQVSNDACTLTITDVYNMGTVAANGAAGGLIGCLPKNWGNGGTTAITNAYSGSANALLGALDAEKPTTLTSVYVLSGQKTAGTLAEGASLTGQAEEKTAAEMQEKAFGKTALGKRFTWDFQSPQINGGYPVLKWQNGMAREPVTLEGTGGRSNPFKIYDANDLAALRDKVRAGAAASAVLMADIDLRDELTTAQWTPLGDLDHKYSGVFDGQGHTIRGIRISNSTDQKQYDSLFGVTTGATIKNLTISDSEIVSTVGYAAAFVGLDSRGGTTFINCHTTESVTIQGGGTAAGIICNWQQSGTAGLTMTQCSNAATVVESSATWISHHAGGLVGSTVGAVTMTDCFNTGSVGSGSTGAPYVGGLIGEINAGSSTGISSLLNCYNRGTVTVSSEKAAAGGLLGVVGYGDLTISCAYQQGVLPATDKTGGIIGKMASDKNLTMNAVYTAAGIRGVADYSKSILGSGAVQVTEEQLKTVSLGTGFVPDLKEPVNDGFQILAWQDPSYADSDILNVRVGKTAHVVRMNAHGSTDAKEPTPVTVSVLSAALDALAMSRINLSGAAENAGSVTLYGALDKASGTLSQPLTMAGGGYTADGLYFYCTPAPQQKTVYAAYTLEGTAHYYEITINRDAVSGTAYGPVDGVDSAPRFDAPLTGSTYDAETGLLTGKTGGAVSMTYQDGVPAAGTETGMQTKLAAMDSFPYSVSLTDESGQPLAFARVGRYLQISSRGGAATAQSGYVPLAAWWGSAETAEKYLAAAEALKSAAYYSAVREDIRTAFEAAIEAVQAGKDNMDKPLYMAVNGASVFAGAQGQTSLPARDYMGAPMNGEYLLEQAENTLLDMTAVIAAWGSSPENAIYKYMALQNINTAKVRAIKDVASAADFASYEAGRNTAWQVLKAADLTAINKLLSRAGVTQVTQLEITTEDVEVTVGGNTPVTVTVNALGSTDPANPTTTVLTTAIPEDDRMERISFTLPEGVKAGTSLSAAGKLSGELALADGRYTADTMYFYNIPKQQSFSVYLVYTESGTAHYYKVTVTRPAREGLSIGDSMFASYKSPVPLPSLSGGKGYACMTVYNGAKALSGPSMMGTLDVSPEWSTDTGALVYADGDQVHVGRYGWYWVPVSHTSEDGETASGYLPMLARMNSNDANAAIKAAQALESSEQYSAIPDAAKIMMQDAIAAVQKEVADNTLNTSAKIEGSSITQRTYIGVDVRGAERVEKESNIILDLTDIFTAWGTDPVLANARWQGYQQLITADGYFHTILDVSSGAERDSYQALRLDKWTVVHAADISAINEVMRSRGLTQVEDPANTVSIGTAAELEAFRDSVNGGKTALNAVLTADITLTGTWTPIEGYAGTFDGAGHTITGLTVSDAASAGLFTATGEGVVIRNLTIAGSAVSGKNYAGAFVGYSEHDVTLENCHTARDVTVTITAPITISKAGGAGGLVGGLYAMTSAADTVQPKIKMHQCSNAAAVTGKGSEQNKGGIGGLIGTAPNGGVITNSCNIGAVTNENTGSYAAAGGLVGVSSTYRNWSPAEKLTLTNVYNAGAVSVGGSGSVFVGGLVGNATWGLNITNAYGTMSVKAGDSYGGIIAGTADHDGAISNVYAEMLRGLKSNSDCKIAISNPSYDNLTKNAARMWSDTEMPVAEEVLNNLGEAFKADTTGSICGHVNYPVLAWQSEPAAEPEPEPDYTLGDVNGDGTIADFKDIMLAIKLYNGVETPEEAQLKAADINGSGEVDFKDIMKIINYYNGIITEFTTQNP